MTTNSDVLRIALEELDDMALGMEVAADAERRIAESYAPERARWDARERGDDRLTRMIRNQLEAESNARRFLKQASALRTVLDHLRQSEKDNSDAD